MHQAPRVHVAPSADGEDAVELVDTTIGQRHMVRFPRGNIDTGIRFSFWGCVVSVVGFALVLTDIPRTGLSLSLKAYYGSVAPSVYGSYGPYAYPSIHINQTTSNMTNTPTYVGTRRDRRVASANVWAYKFDTLSISQRAIAEHLNVASYPDCILYRSACPSPTLSLATTFAMIDGWISAMQTRYFSSSAADRDLPFVFMTRSYWIDRLHHVLVQVLWKRQDLRLHTVQFHAWEAINSTRYPWSLCGPAALPRHRRVRRGVMCDHPIQWRFSHPDPPPLPAPVPPKVTLSRHMELRLAAWRREYPDVELDLTVLTTRHGSSNEPASRTVPMVFYALEVVEITAWTRGRRCLNSTRDCETVFVDDYRYEAATLTSNAEDWRLVTAILRGAAQAYIWARCLCLGVSAYHARSSEVKFCHRPVFIRIFAAVRTLSKVPSHVVVYGSWLPVVCYSAAHMIDSGLAHLVSNNVWASIDGLFQFHLINFVRSASVQMRNVWLVALVGKLVLAALGARQTWTPHHGLLAMRGVLLSFVAWLTIFSFLRALRFRDTNVVAFTPLARHAPYHSLRVTVANVAEFGYRLDAKTVTAATLLVVVYCQLLQWLIAGGTKRRTRFVFCRTYYVPYSGGRLWPCTMLYLFWTLTLRKSTPPIRSPPLSAKRRVLKSRDVATFFVERTFLPRVPNRHVDCSVCNRPQSLIHWKSVQGCVRHDHLFRVDTRPPEVWAMVRLLNLALLSDPLALARVYLWGRDLYVYATKLDSDEKRVDSLSVCRSGFLLPATLEELGDANRFAQLELLMVVNSKTVPWGVLVSCG